jgi:hypothetical protein
VAGRSKRLARTTSATGAEAGNRPEAGGISVAHAGHTGRARRMPDDVEWSVVRPMPSIDPAQVRLVRATHASRTASSKPWVQ